MCGVAGFIDLGRRLSGEAAEAALRRMADRLAHRGPDDWGLWSEPAQGIHFAHRRLAIVDLSPAGHQPMTSASGRYVVVYNGEIYNHRAVRAELEAAGVRDWRGHSDTEVMLAGFDRWGVEATLPRLAGMFSVALWDKERGELMLIRDRAGEKPMYWGRLGERYVFASELGAIEELSAQPLTLDASALPTLMRFGYIPAPRSIYAGIEKLMPGTWVRLGARDGSVTRGTYWRALDSLTAGAAQRLDWSDEACIDELERLLGDSIAMQLEADVPVGAFLSGGIDSSTVVALAQKRSSSPVRTFSIGFDQDGFDESSYARQVAEHLGTRHTELKCSAADALDVVPSLSRIFDEPFADGSQIPTYLVAKLARPSVTVALTGDGGDELFAGYPRYDRAERLVGLHRMTPGPLRRGLASAVRGIPPAFWTGTARAVGHRQASSAHRTLGDRLHRVAGLMGGDAHLVYRYLASSMPEVGRLLPGVEEPGTLFDTPTAWPRDIERSRLSMWLDFMVYLPDDLLVKTDRASMAVALETRVPLLDHRVIEFSHRLPQKMMVRDGARKWLLRQVLYRHVPRAMVDRPKMGFSMPLAHWLRGPLKDWAHALLFPQRMPDEPIDTLELRRLWDEHQSGARDWHQSLWTVLMLRDWRRSRARA